MEKEEYAVACTEILEVLNYVSKEDYNKVPKKVIQVLEKNKKDDIVFLYNPWKDINEQRMSETGRVMLASFFRDYWSTTEQREKIIRVQQQERIRIENEKREKYNTDELFKNKIENKTQEVAMVEVKEQKWFEKIFDFFRKIFRK